MAQHAKPTHTEHGPPTGEMLGPCPVKDAGLHTLSNPSPISLNSDILSPISVRSDPYPLPCLNGEKRSEPATNQHARNRSRRKRLHMEFGRLGRNIRRKLLCGLYQKESTKDSHFEGIEIGARVVSVTKVEDEQQIRQEGVMLKMGSWKLTHISFPNNHESPPLEL